MKRCNVGEMRLFGFNDGNAHLESPGKGELSMT